MEYLIALVVIGGFAYFIYTRVKASKNRPSGTGAGSGGDVRGEPGHKEVE